MDVVDVLAKRDILRGACKECPEFQKIYQIGPGVIVYKHIVKKDNVTVTEEFYVTYNDKINKILPENIEKQVVEHGIPCPRCKYLLEHTMPKGKFKICDHCLKKQRSLLSCQKCKSKSLIDNERVYDRLVKQTQIMKKIIDEINLKNKRGLELDLNKIYAAEQQKKEPLIDEISRQFASIGQEDNAKKVNSDIVRQQTHKTSKDVKLNSTNIRADKTTKDRKHIKTEKGSKEKKSHKKPRDTGKLKSEPLTEKGNRKEDNQTSSSNVSSTLTKAKETTTESIDEYLEAEEDEANELNKQGINKYTNTNEEDETNELDKQGINKYTNTPSRGTKYTEIVKPQSAGSCEELLSRSEEKLKKIKGCKIVDNRPEKVPKGVSEREPILFKTVFDFSSSYTDVSTQKDSEDDESHEKKSVRFANGIHYVLSNRKFIDKGYTKLPSEKIMRKINIYQTKPAHPEYDWFERNKDKGYLTYDSGEKFAEFNEEDRCCWYYKCGTLALDYYNAQEIRAKKRFVIYSNGLPDEFGKSRPVTVLASFDYCGNGVVYDHTGKMRLKYNQNDGIVLDKSLGPVTHWKWHSLNDPPVFQRVMVNDFETLPFKDPDISQNRDNEPIITDCEEAALELENKKILLNKKSKSSENFKLYKIKIKAVKINETFSLRIVDQAAVFLLFRNGSMNIKLNLGMVLDDKEIIATDFVDPGEVWCSLDRLPALSSSLTQFQHTIDKAKKIEKADVKRKHRVRPPSSSASTDRVLAALSKPLRPPLLTASCCRMDCKCNGLKSA